VTTTKTSSATAEHERHYSRSFSHDVLKVQFLQVVNIFIPILIIHSLIKLNVFEALPESSALSLFYANVSILYQYIISSFHNSYIQLIRSFLSQHVRNKIKFI